MGENILEIYVGAENVSYKETDRIVSYVEKNKKKYMGRAAKNIKIRVCRIVEWSNKNITCGEIYG